MFYKLFLTLIFSTSIYAQDGIWSDSSTSDINEKEAKEILRPFKDSELISLSFIDDIEEIPQRSDYQRNILVLGLGAGFNSSEETISTKRDSSIYSYTGSNYKALIGKDFSLWHDYKSQPVRLFVEYELIVLDTGANISNFSFGLQENFTYWPLYTSENTKLFPFIAAKLGGSEISGLSTDTTGSMFGFDLGLTYRVKHIEYALSYAYSSYNFDYPVEGVEDSISQNKFYLSLTYKFMYEGH